MRAVILGYGARGRTYAQYALSHPSEYELVAIADPLLEHGGDAPPGPARFGDWRQALDAAGGLGAEAAVVALPDRLHCEAAVAALSLGLHVLLEKPAGCTWQECEHIRAAQRASRRLVLTGYVLRFATYYRVLMETLRAGEIGKLVSIHHLVEIGFGKAAHAFCRGNWGREEDGASTLVQKCTHDFDLIEWWTGGRMPLRVHSCGSLVHWRPEDRPQGAAARCIACAESTRRACPFDAVRLYLEQKDLRYHFADESDAAMRELLERSPYGRCVYSCGNDAVNRQNVIMEFPGGLIATLEMVSFSARRRRLTRFYGTRGEIVADGEKISITPFIGEPRTITPRQEGRHGGGDREIMAEFARLAKSASSERYAALLDAALTSHRIAFLAEESRKSQI